MLSLEAPPRGRRVHLHWSIPAPPGRRAAERISGSASGQNFRIDVNRSSFINEEGTVGSGMFDFIALKGNCAFYRDSENPGTGKARCHFGTATRCTGDVKFCGNMEALRDYVVKNGLGWQKGE